ncbi:MAG: N-acetylmuramic acid 6-phosphate etherase [Rhizobiaceae bacterium]|nr:N-acetylmuramic acid 6-phosphate etherase [Rhizobiaceae bacterium]
MDPETISPRLRGFDTWSDMDILEALWQGQAGALAAVHAILPSLAAAARDMANRLEVGGRLIFAGAGTSGQIAALEAAELPATFGWPPDRVRSLTPEFNPFSPEATEDNADHGARAMEALQLSPLDVVVAVAASGDTPFTCAAAAHAFASDALVVALFNRKNSLLGKATHHSVFIDSGIEIPAGSTRMNAGTSQKAALNLLSVLVMTRLGRVHDGLMVNLMPSRPKFRQRATRIVAAIIRCSDDSAERLLLQAGGDIKHAVLMGHGCERAEAEAILGRNAGNLRKALLAIDRQVSQGSNPVD